jgi:syntaxin 5
MAAGVVYQNRLGEFRSICDSMQTKAVPVPSAAHLALLDEDRERPAISPKSQFMQSASLIGKSIAATTQKLKKLAKLCAKKNVSFDDPTAEIANLTVVIKNDIALLTRDIDQLRSTAANQPGAQSSLTIVDQLNHQLKGNIADFTKSLKTRAENMQVQENRRNQFSSSNSLQSGRAFALKETEASSGAAGGQQQMKQLAVRVDAHAEQQAQAVETIEKTMLELNSMMIYVGEMILAQQHDVDSILTNADEIDSNIGRAQDHLNEYSSKLKQHRGLILKVFLVLFVFVMLWFAFFV